MTPPANLITARALFVKAGIEVCAVGVDAKGYVIVNGKGGEVVMTQDGWDEYRRICQRWGHIIHDMPSLPPLQVASAVQSMRAAFATLVGDLAGELGAIDALLQSCETTLSVDDYGDALTGARRRLGEIRALVEQVANLCARGGAAGE